MKKEKSVYVEPYDVDKLREIYVLNVKYLDAVKQLKKFNNLITKDVKKYESELKEKFGLNKLKKEEKKLSDKLWEYEKLKPDYEEHEDGIEEFDMFSEEELEDYFETSKKYELLKRKIKKEEEKINDVVSDFKKQKKELKEEDRKALESVVISKGLKIIDVVEFKEVKDRKYSMEKIHKMLIENKYIDPYVRDEDWEQKDISADMIDWNLKLNNWFGDVYTKDYDKTQIFKSEKLSKNYPSTLEYFVKSLQKHTGKEYEKVNLVTNETGHWHDHYEPDVYYVYTATILAPKDIAEMLKKTEKKLTTDSIEKLVKNNKEVIYLTDGDKPYYEDNYNDKDMYKKEKFNETYREQVREKIAKSKESNQIKAEDLFGIKDHEYNLNGEKIVEDLPTKEVAEAAFDTLEYAKKLVRLSELEKVVEKHKKQQEAEKEYEELKKSL